VPVLPSCLLEPLWDQFAALLPQHVDTHPLGCHNPRTPDRVVFEHVIAALVHGSGYERIASPGCSDRTIRRRIRYWADLGIAEQVHALALQAYDWMIGLELEELSVDGCITKAPCGGQAAGRSPASRSASPPPGPTDMTRRCSPRPCRPPRSRSESYPSRSTSISTAATTAARPAPRWPSWASPARSPARACPHPSRPANAGWSNAATHG
jgi:hypothetical protein